VTLVTSISDIAENQPINSKLLWVFFICRQSLPYHAPSLFLNVWPTNSSISRYCSCKFVNTYWSRKEALCKLYVTCQ